MREEQPAGALGVSEQSRGGDRPRLSWPRLAALAVTSLVVAQLPTFLTASVAVQLQRDLGFGRTALGAAIAGSLIASFGGSVVLSQFVQRHGWATGMRASAVLSAASLLGVALLARSWWTLAVLLVVGGAAKALGHPSANLALAVEGSTRRQGLLFGIKQSGVPAAATLSGLSVPLIALTLGWQATFLAAAAIAIVFGLALPRESTAPRAADPRRASRGLASPTLLVLALGAGLGVAVTNTVAAFLTTYAVAVGFGEGAAGLLLAVSSTAGLLTRIAAGWLADHTRLGLPAVALLIVAGAGGVVLLDTAVPTLVIPGSILALGAGWGYAGLFNLTVVRTNPDAPAIATGITQAGVYAGAALGPLVFGIVSEQLSFTVAWGFLALVGLSAAATMLVGARLTAEAAGVDSLDKVSEPP